MGFYHERILPFVINAACSAEPVMQMRRQIVPLCYGTVLEVGAGTGINFGLYEPSQVAKIWALEPSEGMRRLAHRRWDDSSGDRHHEANRLALEIDWLDLPGEQVPLPDQSVDTVLLTYTLCTIGDYHRALLQMHRVLKPGGQLLYCEHGLAPDAGVRRAQNFLTPIWKRLAGGCHLNRPIQDYISQAGFEILSNENQYLAKLPKFAAFTYSGRAVRIG